MERRGSAASDKALARAVRDWREIHFHSDQQTVAKGWLIGLDDYHYVVAEIVGKGVQTVLVHKRCLAVRITRVTLHEEGRTPTHDTIREWGTSFREWMLANHLGYHQPAKEPALS